jgi:hypothetical protein
MTKNTKVSGASATVDDPVAVARAEVERLNSSELGIAILYRARAADQVGVRAARGDQVLDASDPAGAARVAGQRVSAMLEELESLADASRRARERRLVAIPLVYAAEADAADRKAAQLDVDAANLEAESGRLRKALEAHDDWSYVAASPNIPERGFGGQQLGGAPIVGDARGPRHERLRVEARALRTQAAQGRFHQPQRAGGLEADTVEDLFAAVHSDAMRIGPPVDAIVSWSEQAIEKERARRARITSGDGFVPAEAPMRLRLEWRSGTIDLAQSRIVQPEPAEVRAFLDSAADISRLGPLADEPAGAGQPDPYGRSLEPAQVGLVQVGERSWTREASAAPIGAGSTDKVRRRPESSRDPHDTSATAAEIEREAAATGKSIEQVAAELGVAVPESLAGGVTSAS